MKETGAPPLRRAAVADRTRAAGSVFCLMVSFRASTSGVRASLQAVRLRRWPAAGAHRMIACSGPRMLLLGPGFFLADPPTPPHAPKTRESRRSG